MNVGEFVDQLMGHDSDFAGEVVPAEALVAVILPDGTIVELQKVEYEFDPDNPWAGTLWLRGDYR
jgi:hypothetical protein